MTIIDPLDLVESVSNLVVSQPTDQPPEQTLNLTVIEQRSEVRFPYCEYDETFTKSLIAEFWSIFCVDLLRDSSGALAFERLVPKIQTKFHLQAVARDMELENNRRETEAKVKELISSHETQKRLIELKNEVKVKELISSHETQKRLIELENEVKVKELISSHETQKREIELKNENNLTKLISSHQIKEQAIKSTYERRLDTAEADRENVKTKQMGLEAAIQAHLGHLATQTENVEHLRREVANIRERLPSDGKNGVFPGSVTRSDAWKGIKSNINNKINQVFVTFSKEELVPESRVRHLVDQVFPDEKDMYTPVTQLMTELFENAAEERLGVKVHDTHKNPFLSGYMPDITVTLGNLHRPDELSVYCVVELKTTSKLNDAAFGQTVDYLLALSRVQPNRRCIAALLSSIHENYVITLEIKDHSSYITQYASVSFAKAMTYIKNVVLKQPRYFPTVPAFSAKLGTMEKRLGNPQNSVVGEFKLPAGLPAELVKFETMAVKRAAIGVRNTDIAHEISLLELIRCQGGCSELPTLIYVSDNRDEFGIVPVGHTLDRNNPGTGPIIRRILENILTGIQWLHRQKIVHRDIRWDNIVIYHERAYLIDLGNSVVHDDKPRLYAGGYICCPRDLIGDMDKEYVPAFADDYMAFLLLISLLLFPGSGKGMTSRNLAKDSLESKRMKRFWKEMRESTFWGPYYQAAEHEDGEKLKELFNLFVTL